MKRREPPTLNQIMLARTGRTLDEARDLLVLRLRQREALLKGRR
jgi:hypothetical protein